MNVVDWAQPIRTRPTSLAAPVVFVVDEDVAIRESLELLIRNAGWEPESFACSREFLSRPRVHTPSCLIIDIDLPDISGLDLQRLVADRVAMPIIFISACADIPMTVQAMKAGAVEFLTKPLRGEMVASAVRQAIDRSRAVLEREVEIRGLEERFATLSRREREVMKLVASGLLNKQVGAELGISEFTVKAHRGKMMRKMKAASLAELVHLVEGLQPRALPLRSRGHRHRGVRCSRSGGSWWYRSSRALS